MKIHNLTRNGMAIALSAILLSFIPAPAALAQAAGQAAAVDILPAREAETAGIEVNTDEETHPPLRLTPDKSELVRLERKASTVIIGNPSHMSILADSADTLVLVPRVPGASHFTVLDDEGKIVMQRHVIVASPQKKYVRIRRACAAGGGDDCQQTRVFYCPDMCHEIQVSAGEESGGGMSGSLTDIAAQAGTRPAGGTGSSVPPAPEAEPGL